MFRKTSGFTEVMNRLDRNSFNQFNQAIDSGALLSALEISAKFSKIPSPPAPSPVGAHLINISLFVWDNIRGHLNDMKSYWINGMGRQYFKKWSQNVKSISKDHDLLLAYTIPLFAENMMNSMSNSPSPAQDVFLRLISPIIDSNASISDINHIEGNLQYNTNATIYVVLYAGRVPYTITLYEKTTLNEWKDYLEAATCLLLPQVVFEAERQLRSGKTSLMRKALKEQVSSWRLSLPTVGDIKDWNWLPKLV